MTDASDAPTYDLFISYSTDPDAKLARELESFLESFHDLKTPSDLKLRALRVCRDGSDFSLKQLRARGAADADAVGTLIDTYLRRSQTLLVLCSRRASESPWVDLEVRWFLEHRGAENVLLAAAEGQDPRDAFSARIRDARLDAKPWYDFREFRGRAARAWSKVKGFDDERVRLAADLNDVSAGDVQPIWFREQARARRRRRMATGVAAALVIAAAAVALYQGVVARREQGLKLIADSYELLYRDPSAAFLKAYRASALAPGAASREALMRAYKVTVLHHHNRRELDQLTGSGPAHFAGRWSEGSVFAETSPDGRYRLVATERGDHGPDPPGDVYLIDNESLRTVKLEPCTGFDVDRRVENVSFDERSSRVFVSRHYEVSIYALGGRCIGAVDMSCCTKSPVHLVRGRLGDRLLIVAESKGGLWLVDPDHPNRRITLQREFHGDPAFVARLSPDRSRALVVFESGRSALITMEGDGASMQAVTSEGVLFAAFERSSNNRFRTTGEDGTIRGWRIDGGGVEPTESAHVADTAIDWLSDAADAERILAIGANHTVYVLNAATNQVVDTVRDERVDWTDVRTVAFDPVTVSPKAIAPLQPRSTSDVRARARRTLEGAARTWIVADEPGESGFPTRVTYLIDGERAVTYPSLTVDAQAIEQHGYLVWLRSGTSAAELRGGPLLRFDEGDVSAVAGWATAIVRHRGRLYIGTSGSGLLVLDGDRLSRITRERSSVGVQELRVVGKRLLMATNRGAYVVEDDRVLRITEPFLNVRRLSVGFAGDVWLLSGETPPGPAYLVDGYFARPLPSRLAHVADVVAAGGKVWLVGGPGLHLFDGGRTRPVTGVKEQITVVREDAERSGSETQTGFPPEPGPTYTLDPATLRATPVASGAGG